MRRPQSIAPVPDDTARVARAAFPQGPALARASWLFRREGEA